jgi:hypothetical protein
MYRKLKAICGKFNKSGFTSINVPTLWPSADSNFDTTHSLPDPKQATEWKAVNLPEEIVYYLLLCNQLHFGQAHGTPMTTPILSQKIDWKASTESAELILNGNFDDSKLPDLQALLLKHCQCHNDQVLPQYITEAEFISKFKTWNESTSTSPLGIHLGQGLSHEKQR